MGREGERGKGREGRGGEREERGKNEDVFDSVFQKEEHKQIKRKHKKL